MVFAEPAIVRAVGALAGVAAIVGCPLHRGALPIAMAKDKTTFTCTECGGTSPRWLGKCPSCGAWNT